MDAESRLRLALWRRSLRRWMPLGRPRAIGGAIAVLAVLLPLRVLAAPDQPPASPVAVFTWQGAGSLAGIAVDPALGRVFVADFDGVVWAIDAASGRLLGDSAEATGGASAFPAALTVDADRHQVDVVTTYGDLAFMDGRSGVSGAPLALAEATGLALDSASGRVLVVQRARKALVAVDAGRQMVVATVALDWPPSAVAVDAAARRVYVADASGERLAVLDATTYRLLGRIKIGIAASALAVDPAAHRVYAADATSGLLAVIDGSRDVVLATFPVGRTPGALALNPTTGRLFVADADGGVVTVVDPRRNAVAGTVAVGGQPVGVAVDQRSGRVYVANSANRTVSVLQDNCGPVGLVRRAIPNLPAWPGAVGARPG